MFAFTSHLFENESIIEGIGNELLILISFIGIILFVLVAWLSTGVRWQPTPVRITIVQETNDPEHIEETNDNAGGEENSGSQETSGPDNEHIDEQPGTGESDSDSDEDEDGSLRDAGVSAPPDGNTSAELASEIHSDQHLRRRQGALKDQEAYASRFRSKGHLVLRLQYMNDKTRFVHAAPDTLISRFKKKHFSEELALRTKAIRLIFQGRELCEYIPLQCLTPERRPAESPNLQPQRLSDYNVQDGCTIHCLITNVASPPTGTSPNTPRSNRMNSGGDFHARTSNTTNTDSLLTEFDMGTRLMEPLFAFLLALTWFFRIAYRQYFNSLSTFALIALTVIFCSAVFTADVLNAFHALNALVTRRQGTPVAPTTNESNISASTGSTTNQTGSADIRVVSVTVVARRSPRSNTTQSNSATARLSSSETTIAPEGTVAITDENSGSSNSVLPITSESESHSEIERKRRERMKRDTDFLRKQISNSQCKDKLSTFQAGAERLIQYTDKLGKREYIINDQEYSRLIMSNFSGFDVHIRCSDGKILRAHKNVEKILDIREDDLVGRTLQEVAEPSQSTARIIRDAFRGSESQWDIFKGLVARNFILALRCGPNIPLHHCVHGSDGRMHRFIEFCGDLSQQTDTVDSASSGVTFRGLCRPLDPACGAVGGETSDSSRSASSAERRHFTLRLCSKSFRITESVGEYQALLGYPAERLVQKKLTDLVLPSEQECVHRLLGEAQSRNNSTGVLHLPHEETGQPVPLEARLTAIRLGPYLHCIVCRLDELGSSTASLRSKPDSITMRTGYNSHNNTGQVIDHTAGTTSIPGPSITSIKSCEDSPISTDCVSHLNNIKLEESVQPEGSVGMNALPEQKTFFTPIPSYPQPSATMGQMNAVDSVAGDEWFQNVDTSGFKQLLNDGNPLTPECFMGMLQSSDSSPES